MIFRMGYRTRGKQRDGVAQPHAEVFEAVGIQVVECAVRPTDPDHVGQVLRQPAWLAGAAAQTVGWVMQALALDHGSVVVVQSVISLSLVIALPLGARLTDQVITRDVTIAAVATLAGIVLFLSVGVPQSGSASPTAADWWPATLVTAAAVWVLMRVGRGLTTAARAALPAR